MHASGPSVTILLFLGPRFKSINFESESSSSKIRFPIFFFLLLLSPQMSNNSMFLHVR